MKNAVVSIMKCSQIDDFETVKQSVAESLDLIGGLEKVVSSGDSVMINPRDARKGKVTISLVVHHTLRMYLPFLPPVLPGELEVDVLFITHTHEDHLDLAVLAERGKTVCQLWFLRHLLPGTLMRLALKSVVYGYCRQEKVKAFIYSKLPIQGDPFINKVNG